jgi:hypothetical protein
MTRLATGVAAAVLVAACGGSLRLIPIKTTSGKPSNVAVYFRVEGGKDEPIGGLTADKFRIYEDGLLVSQYESKQTIINPEVAASHYTLLLVDMSGSIANSGAAQTLVEAAGAFTERVQKQQRVAVYAFDGSENLTLIAPFTSGGGAKAAIAGLASYKPRDPSTNLNGAIINGLKELEAGLAQADRGMRMGTLVVFSDGTDRAHRVDERDMKEALSKTPYDVFAIGLGNELSESQLRAIGKDGTARAENKEEVVKAFDKIAERIEARTKSYYLLSYCSPSRAGKHKVRIEGVVKSEDGKSERTGSLTQEFDATGFGPNCDPNSPPPFDIHKGDALAPKKEDKKEEPVAKKEPRKKEEKKEEKREEKKEDKRTTPKQPATPPPPPPPPPASTQQQADPFQP